MAEKKHWDDLTPEEKNDVIHRELTSGKSYRLSDGRVAFQITDNFIDYPGGSIGYATGLYPIDEIKAARFMKEGRGFPRGAKQEQVPQPESLEVMAARMAMAATGNKYFEDGGTMQDLMTKGGIENENVGILRGANYLNQNDLSKGAESVDDAAFVAGGSGKIDESKTVDDLTEKIEDADTDTSGVISDIPPRFPKRGVLIANGLDSIAKLKEAKEEDMNRIFPDDAATVNKIGVAISKLG